MLPSDRLRAVIRVTSICTKLCGVDIADPNYKVNSITFLVIFCIVVYFIFSIYTINLKIHEGWGILLESFCMVGSVLQGISKLATGIKRRNTLRANLMHLESLYVKYEKKGKEYSDVLNTCIARVTVILKCTACLYAALVVCLTGGPVFIWISTGRQTLPMQYYIPKVDPNTKIGYFITAGMQYTCITFGTLGNFAGDIYILIYFTHCPMFVNILNLKINELNDLVDVFGNPNDAEKMLMDVLKWHQTYSDHLEDAEKCSFWVNFTQITTSGISIVLTLFIMFTGDWPGSHSYLCLSFSVMYLYCGMGTLAEVANDDIIDIVYEIHWYNMSVNQQKIVGFVLMKSQSPKKITVGGVVPLSVTTGLQVTKTVYSVFMMLLNFFA